MPSPGRPTAAPGYAPLLPGEGSGPGFLFGVPVTHNRHCPRARGEEPDTAGMAMAAHNTFPAHAGRNRTGGSLWRSRDPRRRRRVRRMGIGSSVLCRQPGHGVTGLTRADALPLCDSPAQGSKPCRELSGRQGSDTGRHRMGVRAGVEDVQGMEARSFQGRAHGRRQPWGLCALDLEAAATTSRSSSAPECVDQ